MMDLCAPFCCKCCHVQCAFAVADDHNPFAVEHLQGCDITFGEDAALELFLIEELRQILAICVLSRREQKKIKIFFLNTLPILITDDPALCILFCFKNFMIEPDVKLVMLHCLC